MVRRRGRNLRWWAGLLALPVTVSLAVAVPAAPGSATSAKSPGSATSAKSPSTNSPATGARTSASTDSGTRAHTGSSLVIRVLSNRADLVSAGDALVEVSGPGRSALRDVRVTLNGADITSRFAVRADGRYLGLVTGLRNGRNELRASAPLGRRHQAAKIVVTNHPRGGPVFAGAQVQPWDCDLHRATTGLGEPTDAQCNTPTVYQYVYRPRSGTGFLPFDPAAPATDVATTTTDAGHVVPYIVRVETGVLDRGIYSVAALFNPAQPWAPWQRQAGWNGKVLYGFGGGSAPWHVTAEPGSVLDDVALSRGYLVATSGLNVHGANNNTVVSAETVSMLKEHVVETYGEIRFTIGTGCSGGSIQQQLIAEQYPGLLNAIQPNCSYPDTWTTGVEVQDCGLLVRYFGSAAAAGWSNAQKAAVAGTQDTTACAAWNAAFVPSFLPSRAQNCGWAEGDPRVYQPVTNPGGTRCSLPDYQVAIWGTRPAYLWTPQEQAAGRGFARSAADNTGVLYGLGALRAGVITGQQFTDLNVGIGGNDLDGGWRPARTVADPGATATAYRSGQVTQGYRLDEVPIIDLRGSSNTNDIHTDFHSYELRARLDAANGNHANQVIWTWRKQSTPSGIVVPTELRVRALDTLDTWLTAIAADRRNLPVAAKVRAHKPASAIDTCWPEGTAETGLGPAVTDPGYTGPCREAFGYFGDARQVAGEPATGLSLKCSLAPLRRQALPGLTSVQFARLTSAFPGGVCDWRRPPVGYRASQPWLSFARGPGGTPIGPPPRSVLVRNR
jgi:uncharacterized tannase-like protein DUF6351